MKLFFIADIHGSIYYLNKALQEYEKVNADYLILLGDLLYHGARNDLPKEYNPKEVTKELNRHKDEIIAVRGNCDSEVDQMVLEFPIGSVYSNLLYNGKRLFLTHGHIYNENNMVPLKKGSSLIYGHTHILRAEEKDGIYYLNPGSITFPKENNPHTFGLIEDNKFVIKTLEGETVKEINI